MEKNRQHIDNLFKEELGSHTETPPSAVWDALEKRLGEKRRKRPFPYRWFWYISLVSFVILLGAAAIWKMKGDVHTEATIAAAADNVMSAKKDATTTAASNTNNYSATNNTTHNIHTKHLHNKKTATATNTNTTERVATHRSKTRKREQAKTTQNDKKKTDDDLYADTDDDQYTVGYSSNTRKNTTGTQNENLPADYTLEQRNQDNILVAEVNPEQHVRETGYGNRYSVQTTQQTLQNTNTTDRPTNARSYNSSTSNSIYAKNSTPKLNNHTHAHNKTYTKATVTNTVIARNTTDAIKTTVNQSQEIATDYRRKHKTISHRATHTNVAATAPAIKTGKELAVVAPAKENANKMMNGKSPASEHIVTAATPVVNTKTAKQVAAIVPVKENGQVNNTNIAGKKTHIHKAASQPAADKSIAAVSTPENKTKSVPAPTVQPVTVVNASVNTNKIGATAKEDTKEIAVSPKKKTTHSRTRHTDPTVNANAAIVKNTVVAGNTDKHPEQEKATIRENHHTQPVAHSGADKSIVKHTKKQSAGHQANQLAAVQKNTTGLASKPAGSGNNSNAPSAKKVAKTKRAAHKQPAIKEDKPLNVVAASTDIGKPVKEKNTSAKKSMETVASTEKQTSGPGTSDKLPVADKKTTAAQTSVAKTGNKKGRKETSGKTGNTANSTNNTVSPPPAAPPVYVYNNSISKRNLEEETVIADNVRVNTFNAQHNDTLSNAGTIPATFKQNDIKTAKPDSTIALTATDTTAKRHWFSRHFEAGIKGGYEMGFNKDAANKFVVSPYIQYNLSDKLSIMVQPAVKVSHLNDVNVGSPKSYVDTIAGSAPPKEIGSGPVFLVLSSGGTSFIITDSVREYAYSQKYDSVVKSNSLKRTYTEFEMPLLLKYKIYKQLSVYGGVNIVFGKSVGIAENTYTSGTLVMNKIGATLAPGSNPAPLPPPMSSVIQYNNPFLSAYVNPYPSPSSDLLRLGYMLGFSYEFKKRWLFDILVQQAVAKPNNEGGINTNAPLSLPYFRFTLGYKLTK